mmetsp:Transcript_20387/g.52974  ORF Transcript_20387/g.52974 Transcript_20387/m.52974 type:complete len:209 (+) Transcript_20387:2576-3202(+)
MSCVRERSCVTTNESSVAAMSPANASFHRPAHAMCSVSFSSDVGARPQPVREAQPSKSVMILALQPFRHTSRGLSGHRSSRSIACCRQRRRTSSFWIPDSPPFPRVSPSGCAGGGTVGLDPHPSTTGTSCAETAAAPPACPPCRTRAPSHACTSPAVESSVGIPSIATTTVAHAAALHVAVRRSTVVYTSQRSGAAPVLMGPVSRSHR